MRDVATISVATCYAASLAALLLPMFRRLTVSLCWSQPWSALKRMNRFKTPFGLWTWLRPMNEPCVRCRPRSPQGRGNFLERDIIVKYREYSWCGRYSKRYSVVGNSDAAVQSQHISYHIISYQKFTENLDHRCITKVIQMLKHREKHKKINKC